MAANFPLTDSLETLFENTPNVHSKSTSMKNILVLLKWVEAYIYPKGFVVPVKNQYLKLLPTNAD
jgi:hypothetical protein